MKNGVRTNYLVDPMRGVSQVLIEYDNNGQILAEYTYGLGLIKSDRSDNETYYHTDGLGSTRLLTNTAGQVVDTYTYDAYGRLLSQTGTEENSYQFAGEQRDLETGLDYLRASNRSHSPLPHKEKSRVSSILQGGVNSYES